MALMLYLKLIVTAISVKVGRTYLKNPADGRMRIIMSKKANTFAMTAWFSADIVL